MTEDTEAAGLKRLTVLSPLFVERGRGFTFDLNRNWAHWTATSTLFTWNVHHPLYTEQQNAYTLRNLVGPTENIGVENVVTWRKGEFSSVASYTFTQAREKPGLVRQDVELTPRNSAGLVGTWERENVARIGIEAYYTGVQRLDDNPYRTFSEPYVLFGFLVENRFGRFKAYLNAQDLRNVRQTNMIHSFAPHAVPMADGRQMLGHRWMEGYSTEAYVQASSKAEPWIFKVQALFRA